MKHMLKCEKCGKYTFKEVCPHCGGKALNPKPPKFSMNDPYESYKRKAKEPELIKKGLI